ncbi:hypothetical protein [Bacillus sp. FJAT-28004]|uniref:hypothetical protein n=1 Tax=Bacillus sp. FJAT-28004 TaxID=1679165 RepID=UPI0006B5A81E|nr:hypothetical protein [Bacillus sp. FJAT-28004]
MKRLLNIVLITYLIISFSVQSPNKVFACSCGHSSIEQKFEGSGVIFTGTLVSKDKEGGNIFNVEKAWKGNLTDGYVYSGFNGMCGTEFEVGNTYLVYTNNVKGKEMASLCSGNKLINEASKDIQALDRLYEPEWKDKYILILLFAFAFAVVISIILWRAKLRFKK